MNAPLTRENYFSLENTAISSTKVRDFLKSKEYYYKRYVTGEILPEITPSLTLGKLVDECIEHGTVDWFKSNYEVAVLKRDDPEAFLRQKSHPERVVSEDTYARVIGMCDKIFRAPFFSFYNPLENKGVKSQFQVPLWAHIKHDGAEFDICGLIDVLSFRNENGQIVAYIDDLKTTSASAIRSPQAWAYHVKDYGYQRQMGCYRRLIKEAYPEVSRIVCRHFVVGTSKADYHPLRLYRFSDALLDQGEKEFLEVAKEISQEQRFIDDLPTWDEAVEIPDISSLVEEVTDEEMDEL